MKPNHLKLSSERLTLIPYTTTICVEILDNNFKTITELGLKPGKLWPDADIIETIPRIIKNINKVGLPTGFESWMIIKSDTNEIIGDIGFKGFNRITSSADIGYGIIASERRNGYAIEACKTLIEWAFQNESLKSITAACLLDNVGSANLLEKLNFEKNAVDEEFYYWILEKNKS